MLNSIHRIREKGSSMVHKKVEVNQDIATQEMTELSKQPIYLINCSLKLSNFESLIKSYDINTIIQNK